MRNQGGNVGSRGGNAKNGVGIWEIVVKMRGIWEEIRGRGVGMRGI